jgi:hypothetical protein
MHDASQKKASMSSGDACLVLGEPSAMGLVLFSVFSGFLSLMDAGITG